MMVTQGEDLFWPIYGIVVKTLLYKNNLQVSSSLKMLTNKTHKICKSWDDEALGVTGVK